MGAQLKMYWLPGTPIKCDPLPEGYSFSNYKCEEDKQAWFEICLNGLTREEDGAEAAFNREIATWPDIDPYKDLFFLDYNGRHVGTITAFVYKETRIGDVHMVAIRTECRGQGLARFMTAHALKKLEAEGVRFVSLTTSEGRRPALKSYLSAGFLPVEWQMGMQDRWEAVLADFGIESLPLLYEEDASVYKILHKKGVDKEVFKIGVFGSGRGRTMMNYCKDNEHAELVAICDMHKEGLEDLKKVYGETGTKYFTDFDEFIKEDMDLVVLANYANAHTPFAIKALKAGKNVLSEVLPVQCMKEAVDLIETVESSGKFYAYAENYCFMPAPKRMRKMFFEGKLGKFEYGEGEYMHNCEPSWAGLTRANPEHWRNTMSAFYYCTHSLGPLIHIARQRPVSVVGFEGPYNERMYRMGALGGPFGVEMVTLESGAILKSLHGVGPSRNSVWYSCYGSKGRVESAREDACLEKGGVQTCYSSYDKLEGDNDFKVKVEDVNDALTEAAGQSGHGGSDYYIMYNVIEKLRGNRNVDVIDVYEAMDMFLPGLFAYKSVRAGGIPMQIPNLRDPAEREKWRNDVECVDPAVAGDQVIPSYSKGNPAIPQDNYDRLAEKIGDNGKRCKEEQAYYAKLKEENKK